MNKCDRDELRRLEGEATPRWRYKGWAEGKSKCFLIGGNERVAEFRNVHKEREVANIELAIAARNALVPLLDALDAAEAGLVQIESDIDSAEEWAKRSNVGHIHARVDQARMEARATLKQIRGES